MKFIDLFGGIGGFRYGIEKANNKPKITGLQTKRGSTSNNLNTLQRTPLGDRAECVFYCDNDKYAVQTYNKNFGENWKPTDIRTIDADKLPDFDMLCGGYPCQSFSIAGKRKGFADTRGTLFFEIERIAKEKQPKIIFLENVKGLLSHDKGNTFKTITKHLNSLGYLVDYRVLNSKYFGVPQNRERVFHIGFNLKWLIKESVEDGQVKRNSLLDKIIKGWMLENLLKDLNELKKLPELKLKEWVLGYLRYIVGNQTRLEYLKTIKDIQINNFQSLLKEQLLQLPKKEENSNLILKERKKCLKMVQDICESMMEKGTDCGFIESWQKNILEILKKNSQFTTSTLIKKIIEKKTFLCAEINLIIGLFILQQKDYWQDWLNKELSDLIKLEEFIKNEGRRNKGKFRKRYLLRNIRTSMGFTESFDKRRNIIIGSVRGTSKSEILPFKGSNEETKELVYAQKSDREIARIYNPEGIAPTLHLKTGGWQEPKIVAMRGRNPDNPSDRTTGSPTEQRLELNKEGTTNTLSSVQKDNLLLKNMQIRRLTPIECERLQGFPDSFTAEGINEKGEIVQISDTQRYKMCGNAVSVPVIQAIMEKLIKLQ